VREAQAPGLGQDGGELLLGVIRGAIRGGIFGRAEPTGAALVCGVQDLTDQERLKLTAGVAHLGRVIGFPGSVRRARHD